MTTTILTGDCRDLMAAMEPLTVDAIVTDPPYGLSFMGKGWDHGVPGVEFWTQALRVLKPGGYLLAFGGTRTYHRLAVAIEDAGFEIRDCLSWLYGSGFPKSLDVGKAIDKAAGAERDVIGVNPNARNTVTSYKHDGRTTINAMHDASVTAPATDAARQWDGWGTALKPGWEPIIMARKPFRGTVAANVLEWGTGAINVDGCRIGTTDQMSERKAGYNDSPVYGTGADGFRYTPNAAGRWPPNVAMDEEAATMLDQMSGERPTGKPTSGTTDTTGKVFGKYAARSLTGGGDTGGASRFFYVAKASRSERNAGLDGMPERKPHHDEPNGRAWDIPGSHSTARANHHPTVKPVALMRWLVRMVTPPGGVVLDPFAGSFTTGVAAVHEGVDCILMEREPEYVEIGTRRVAHAEALDRQLPLDAA